MDTYSLEGELTIFTAAQLKPDLLNFLHSSTAPELNLNAVTECDTAGLQLLILLKREANLTGKSISFIMHSKAVIEVLELARLTSQFGDPIVLAHS